MVSPITLDALRVLDAIERKNSFAGAAEELFRVPSAISYTVNKLEEDLAVALFDRSKRKAVLTPVGKMLLDQGRQILKATDELTHIVKQSASGWETELRICIDSILLFEPVYKLIAEFQHDYPWINIRVSEEVFGGSWDALNSNRCDLIIGGEATQNGNDFNIEIIGEVDFVFAVAKDHPLTNHSLIAAAQPLSAEAIKQYPSIVVADSSRQLPARSAGLLDGQSRITVPTMGKKISAHKLGLGVGYLPIHRIQAELDTRQLIALTVEQSEDRCHNLCMAWRKDNQGKALGWFVKKLHLIKTQLI